MSLSSVVNENLVPKTPLYQSSEAPAAGSEDKILLFSGQDRVRFTVQLLVHSTQTQLNTTYRDRLS